MDSGQNGETIQIVQRHVEPEQNLELEHVQILLHQTGVATAKVHRQRVLTAIP